MWHTPMTKATTIQEHAATVGAMKAKKGSNGMENGKWSSTNNGVDKISCYLEKIERNLVTLFYPIECY